MYIRWALAMAAWAVIASYLLPADVIDVLSMRSTHDALQSILSRLR